MRAKAPTQGHAQSSSLSGFLDLPPDPKRPPTVAKGDVSYGDFYTNAEAQPYLLPGDPHKLDRDKDGVACDSLP